MAHNDSGYSLRQGQLIDNQITTIYAPDIQRPSGNQNRLTPAQSNSLGYRETWAALRARLTSEKLGDDAIIIRQMPLTRILEGKEASQAQSRQPQKIEHWIEMLRRHRVIDHMRGLQRMHAYQAAINFAQSILASDPPERENSSSITLSASSDADKGDVVESQNEREHILTHERDEESSSLPVSPVREQSTQITSETPKDEIEPEQEHASHIIPVSQPSSHPREPDNIPSRVKTPDSLQSSNALEKNYEGPRCGAGPTEVALPVEETRTASDDPSPESPKLNGNRIRSKSAPQSRKGKKAKTTKLTCELTYSAGKVPESHQHQALNSPRKPSRDAGGIQEEFIQAVQPTKSIGPPFDQLGFHCTLESCRRAIIDADELVRICNGCGPYSRTRYCNIAHVLDDAATHYFFCGLDNMKVPATAHIRYRDQLPQVRDIHGHDNAMRTRQLTYSMHDQSSDYTIFLADPLRSMKLTWPENSEANLTTKLFKRLLNIAFLNHRQRSVLTILYRSIRARIYDLASTTPEPARTTQLLDQLNRQFLCEFCFRPSGIVQDGSKGSGKDLVREVVAICQGMEKRYWILKAWAGADLAAGDGPVLETDRVSSVGVGGFWPLAAPLSRTYDAL